VETGEFVRDIGRPPGDTSDYAEAVSAYGDDLLVSGTPPRPEGGGAGYRFDPTTGDLLATYADPAPQTYGFGVSIGGDAGYVTLGDNHEGAVFVYDADTGELLQTLLDHTSSNSAEFGKWVDVTSNGMVLAGSASGAPEAFLFDAETGDMLHSYGQGYVVAAVRSKVLIGSPNASEGANDAGMAFLYEGETLAGDMDEDSQINGLDVDPFVDALLNDPFNLYGDMNGDGVVTGLDVDPFVASLLGSDVQAVPEPSTLLLCIIAMGVVGGLRKWGG
jgi:outer membrane protein assembly factor BamB